MENTDLFDIADLKLEKNDIEILDIKNHMCISKDTKYIKDKSKKLVYNNLDFVLIKKKVDTMLLQNYSIIYVNIASSLINIGFKLSEYIMKHGYKFKQMSKIEYANVPTEHIFIFVK